MASILAQTERRFELLVMDDGSTDGSAEIAEQAATGDSRVRVVRLPHTGHAAASNAGIGLARGSFIATMDADDVSLPRRFEMQLNHLVDHPESIAVGGATIELYPDGSHGGTTVWPVHTEYRTSDPMRHVGMPGPAAMIRAEALRAVGGYRRAFVLSQDADLWRRLLEIGHIDNPAEPVVLYRRHPGQVSSRFAPLQELSAGVARALTQARTEGGEPDWDSEAPISAASVTRLRTCLSTTSASAPQRRAGSLPSQRR